MVAFLGAVTGWLLFAALVTALGTLTARWVFIPRAVVAFPEAEDRLLAAAGRLGVWASTLLPLAMALVFARQLQEFRDPFVPWAEDAHFLLTATEWGTTWMWAIGASLVGFVAYRFVRASFSAAWWVATLAILGLSAYPALSGHASGTEALRPLTLTTDILHVLAAGAWIGGLSFLIYAERSWRLVAQSEPSSLLPELVPIFSPVAIASVATLIATGSVAAWIHLESVGALVGTSYGRLLSIKLGVVLSVLGLGAVNWRRLTPRLDAEAGQGALRRNAVRELLLAQVVLAVTAILVRTSPLGH